MQDYSLIFPLPGDSVTKQMDRKKSSDSYLGIFLTLNVVSNGLIPRCFVSFVDRIDLASFFDPHVGVCQDKLSNCLTSIEREIKQV